MAKGQEKNLSPSNLQNSTMEKLTLLSLVLFSPTAAHSQTCKTYTFSSPTRNYTACAELPVLLSYLHWTYIPSATTLLVAYRHTNLPTRKWVSWAIIPIDKGMVGCQSIVAYPKTDGSMVVYTSPTSSNDTSLAQGKLSSFKVTELSGVYENREIVIFATIQGIKNTTSVNHVWQNGSLSGNTPEMHPTTTGCNLKSMATLSIISGVHSTETESSRAALVPKARKIAVHAILNTVSWGTMMIVLVIVARYLRFLDPTWFYIHAYGQLTAYSLAVAGFLTGIQLGNTTHGLEYTTHRCIGISLFCFASVQACAILIRPNTENKYRFYWNIYHHTIGYTTLILGVINVFKGFSIMRPDPKWKDAYIGVLVALGFLALVLEANTWRQAFLKKKKKTEHQGKQQLQPLPPVLEE